MTFQAKFVTPYEPDLSKIICKPCAPDCIEWCCREDTLRRFRDTYQKERATAAVILLALNQRERGDACSQSVALCRERMSEFGVKVKHGW